MKKTPFSRLERTALWTAALVVAAALVLALLSLFLAHPASAAPQDAGQTITAVTPAPSSPTTPGAQLVDAEKDPAGAALWLLSNVGKPGYGMLAAAAALLLIVAVVRREKGWLVKNIPWLATRAGGWGMNLGLALAVWLSAALSSGKVTFGGFVGFMSTAGLAALGWQAKKDMAGP